MERQGNSQTQNQNIQTPCIFGKNRPCSYYPDPLPGYAGHVPEMCKHDWKRGLKHSPAGVKECIIKEEGDTQDANCLFKPYATFDYSGDVPGSASAFQKSEKPINQNDYDIDRNRSHTYQNEQNKYCADQPPAYSSNCCGHAQLNNIKDPIQQDDCIFENPISGYAGHQPFLCLHNQSEFRVDWGPQGQKTMSFAPHQIPAVETMSNVSPVTCNGNRQPGGICNPDCSLLCGQPGQNDRKPVRPKMPLHPRALEQDPMWKRAVSGYGGHTPMHNPYWEEHRNQDRSRNHGE